MNKIIEVPQLINIWGFPFIPMDKEDYYGKELLEFGKELVENE